MMSAANSYFAIRLDMISCLMTTILSTICVVLRGSANPIMLGLILTYSLNIANALQLLLKWYMVLEGQMVTATRCLKLKDVEHERVS